jgi:2-C-methyl-D-erythritol 4-phosphate cytidylyltransferase
MKPFDSKLTGPQHADSPQERPTASAVIVAAGSSTRMASAGPRKPLVEIEGRTLVEHVLAAFEAVDSVTEVVLVAHRDDVALLERWSTERAVFAKVCAIVPGGSERADSVRLGAFWCSFESDVICVHDAARPLIDPGRIEAAIALAARQGAALVALPARDTVKWSDDGKAVVRTLERERLWCAQTPQVFETRRFKELVETAYAAGFRPTDDAALWERYVGPVALVPGDAENLKVTSAADLALAAALLRARRAPAEERRA